MDNATSNSEMDVATLSPLLQNRKFKARGSTKVANRYYTVTQVRPNDGGKYDTTSL